MGFPNASEISDTFLIIYKDYGLIVIFLASFVEGLFILSMYLPGSLVIILSAFALGFDFITLLKIGLISILGFTAVNVVNYYLGKYGYYKLLLKIGGEETLEKTKSDFKKNSLKTIFLTSFHPNFLAITMIVAGITNSNLIKVLFQSILSLIFWITLWMTVVSVFFQDKRVSFTENKYQVYYFVIVIAVWGFVKCIIEYYKNRNSQK